MNGEGIKTKKRIIKQQQKYHDYEYVMYTLN